MLVITTKYTTKYISYSFFPLKKYHGKTAHKILISVCMYGDGKLINHLTKRQKRKEIGFRYFQTIKTRQ